MIHEIFNLSDEEAARVLIKLISKIKNRSTQKETIDSIDKENTNERDFAAFIVGFWNALNAARLYPWLIDREIMFVSDIMSKLDIMNEDELVDYIVNKFNTYREKIESERLRDSI